MTTKPDLTRVWAAGAAPANIEDPDVTLPGKFDDGWIAEIPTFENFNFLQQLFTQALAHFNEQGIGVWDSATTYPIDGIAKGSDGKIYTAISAQAGNDPTISPVYWTSTDGHYLHLPSGTAMLFAQAAAPIGWTKSVTHNNKALRIVNTSGGGSGGSVAFTTAFAAARATSSAGSHSHTVTVNSHVLTLAQMPAHTHSITTYSTFLVGSGGGTSFNANAPVGNTTGSAGSNSGHNHTASSAANGSHTHTTDLNVQYVDSLICTKD